MPPLPDAASAQDEPAQDEAKTPIQELPPVLPEEGLNNVRAYVEMKRPEAEEPISAVLSDLDGETDVDAHIVSAHTVLRKATLAGEFPEKGDIEFFLHTLIQARATQYLNDQIRKGADLDKFGKLIKEWRQQGILPDDTSLKKPVLTPEEIANMAAEALAQARTDLDQQQVQPGATWDMEKQPQTPR